MCFFGSLAFLGDATIALVTFPALAASAPELIASDGLMFTGWVLGFFVGFAVLQMFGYIGKTTQRRMRSTHLRWSNDQLATHARPTLALDFRWAALVRRRSKSRFERLKAI